MFVSRELLSLNRRSLKKHSPCFVFSLSFAPTLALMSRVGASYFYRLWPEPFKLWSLLNIGSSCFYAGRVCATGALSTTFLSSTNLFVNWLLRSLTKEAPLPLSLCHFFTIHTIVHSFEGVTPHEVRKYIKLFVKEVLIAMWLCFTRGGGGGGEVTSFSYLYQAPNYLSCLTNMMESGPNVYLWLSSHDMDISSAVHIEFNDYMIKTIILGYIQNI